MPKYLKDIVKEAGGILLLQIEDIGPKFFNDRSKAVRHVTFKIKSSSKIIEEDVHEIKFEKFGLKGAKVGSSVEAFLVDGEGGKFFADYRLVDANAEQSAPMMQTPHQQMQGERKATAAMEAEEAKWRKIDTSKILFGYLIEGYKLGKSPEEAGEDARAFFKKQAELTEELCEEPSAI